MIMSKKIKPVACRISRCGSGTEIIYECPYCHVSFAILGDKESFCHNCGTEIDWNVYMVLKEPFCANPEKEKQLLQYINQENKRKKS